MEIVVRCMANQRFSEEIVPDSLELVSESKGDNKGIGGDLLVFIFTMLVDATTLAVNLKEIAKFIHEIVHGNNAKVSAGDSAIDKADSEEQIASKIKSEANKEIEE